MGLSSWSGGLSPPSPLPHCLPVVSVLACELCQVGRLLLKLAGVEMCTKMSRLVLEFILDEEVDL